MEKKGTFPEYLRGLRKEGHYRQGDVAAYLEISRQTYSHYETGRIRPSVNVLYKMAKFYGVSVESILEHMEGGAKGQEEVSTPEQVPGDVSEQEFIYCYRGLDEKNREDILSIMKALTKAKV